MTRKATTRGRKAGAKRATKSAPRAATRTGKKTASARATKSAPKSPARKSTPKRAAAGRAASVEVRGGEQLEREPVAVAQAEDDEELDWLAEDEDPRSQIVEDDDDDWSPSNDDEW